MKPVILVHGGAGTKVKDEAHLQLILEGVKNAAREGYKILTSENRSVIDAVEVAVKIMELNEVFNAGRGSVLNADGEVEMDASIMVGSDLSAGAVTVVRNIEHPISLARLVMEKTDHVLLAGDGAERFAREHGVPFLPAGSLITDRRKKLWEQEKVSAKISNPEVCGETVGALAIDELGHLAAATSTGGRAKKLVGRSSDTCMIGSGTYADDNLGAVSTTGHGETVAKFCLAHAIIRDLENGKNAQQATTDCIKRMTERLNNTAGAITLSKAGEVGIGFSTEHMSWAYIKNNELRYGATLNDNNVDVL
ncbi:hypothetical protein RI129_001464 [Pyrocoelia pectoralis]|uniref:Asparaginase n=1 Tax=Pyrocoelia pectoralis TaxID=417401 RepID=A0AAN7ZK10_9COLE